MAKYKIVYNQKECIGAGECELVSKKLWKLNSKGKAELNGASINKSTGNYELIVDDTEAKAQKEAIKRCPVECIRMEVVS